MSGADVPPMPAGLASRLRWTVADGWVLVRRELWHLRNQPGQLASALIFPVALVVLFGYVFGSAIAVPGGGDYRDYLMPGLFAMTSAFAVLINAMAISAEKSKGVMDRFRSMPMARLAVPFGQTGADIMVGTMATLIMALCGLAVGWRPHDGAARAIAAFALILMFRYAMSWAGVYLGLALKDEKTIDNLAPLIFPFTMIANTFVPTGHMPADHVSLADESGQDTGRGRVEERAERRQPERGRVHRPQLAVETARRAAIPARPRSAVTKTLRRDSRSTAACPVFARNQCPVAEPVAAPVRVCVQERSALRGRLNACRVGLFSGGARFCWRSGRLARCGMKRLKFSHLLGAAAAAVSALVLLTPGVAAAQAWTVVPSPSGGQLNGVASVSANDVWAVGQTLAPGTLAEHWDGTAWSIVPTPNPVPGSDRLSAVAAVSTSDVWAVGIVSFSSPPVILHWSGKRWASAAHPKQTGFLSGVSAVSANDVWAVGESQVPGVGLQTLIEHWNGRKWSVVPSPNIGPMDQLRGVTAVSANDVWAVGFAEPTSFSNPQTLILHWDGTSWTVVPSPDPAGAQDNELSGATAVSANDVWAVGETGNGAQTLTEHWDGASWAAVSSPSAGRLAGVAAVSASDIWAAGSVTDINGITSTVIEQWNGTSWSVVPSPNPSPNENTLAAASADPASTQSWAVGEFFNTTTSTRQTLTEFNP